MSTLRVFEAFSGVGTQSMALKRLGVNYEVVGIAEIDKFAIQSYMAIHGETKNYGDISKIDPTELPDMDLFTYSFPCQDLSISGKQRGMGEGTRSGLLYECEKVISTKKPKYLLLENVKNLVGKKFKPDFDKWLEWLESQGYSNYWQVLNAKDYGVPQNRERVFVVSILGEDTYEFPNPFPLEVKLKDTLEDEVDEKYFLSTKLLEGFTAHKKRHQEKGTGFQYVPRDINKHASCLRANASLAPTDNTVIVETDNKRVLEKQREFPELTEGKLGIKLKDILCDDDNENLYLSEEMQKRFTPFPKNRLKDGSYKVLGTVTKNPYDGDGNLRYNNCTTAWVYDTESNVGTLASRDYKEPKRIAVINATKQGYAMAEVYDGIDLSYPDSKTRRGRVQPQRSHTLQTSPNLGVVCKDFRIRKLSPKEYWRLMGISDEDFYKAKNSGISDSQLYKQAGNAIVVDVLVGIFGNLFGEESYLSHTDEIDLNDYTFVYTNEVAQQQWRL